MTEWIEVKVLVNHEAVDAVSEQLIALGSEGFAVKDRQDFKEIPNYGFDTLNEFDDAKVPEKGALVIGYFDSHYDQKKLGENLQDKFKTLIELGLLDPHYNLSIGDLDENWRHKWKDYYAPIRISRYLTIQPEWEDYRKERPDEMLIIMDPGLAFGTGSHPTTRLSLQALEMTMRGGERVLDVGTGSGVLAIGAGLLGAKEVTAFDIDDVAVTAARANIALNKLDCPVDVKVNSLLEGVPAESSDLIVANILAHIISDMTADAYKCLAGGGHFIASGIVEEKSTQVQEKMKAAGFEIEAVTYANGWAAIVAKKP